MGESSNGYDDLVEKNNRKTIMIQNVTSKSLETSETILSQKAWTRLYGIYREDVKAKQVSRHITEIRLKIVLPNEKILNLDIDEYWTVQEVLDRLQQELEMKFFSDFGLFERITESLEEQMLVKTYSSSFRWIPNDAVLIDEFINDYELRDKIA